MFPTRFRRWLLWLTAALVVAAGAGWVAACLAERHVLTALSETARGNARLRSALLDSELARFRLLPLALGSDRDVVAAIAGGAAERQALNRKLENLARVTGAAVIYVVAPGGRAIAASNWRGVRSFVGSDYSFRRYFHDAARTGQASQFALGTVSGRPGLYLARRTDVGGVIVVKLEFDRIEAEWARAGGLTYATDPAGVVVVTSRPRWRFSTTTRLSADAVARFRAEANSQDAPLAALPFRAIPDSDMVTVDGRRMIAATVMTSQPGWRLTLLLPTRPSVTTAMTAAGISAALAMLLLAAALWAWRARAAFARRRTEELEQAVAARTEELSREMAERAASDARAANLCEGLQQANRLATLGQVTASVAHETAQPVAAIRAYAQASETLLDRGDVPQVRANLAAISRLTERLGDITTHLRGFARRSAGALRPISLIDVMDGARLILREQLRTVTLEMPPIDPALTVIGGRVRLEQVLVNLLQNAVEALAGQADPRITVTLGVDEDRVRLTVSDNGPGVPPEISERLFTPFVTSRPSGLGLGLVIAHGIMGDLGGTLTLRPSVRGASFEMAMPRA